MPLLERPPVRILLVENHAEDSYYFRLLLRQVPLSTTLQSVETGEAALAALRPTSSGTAPPFDLVFLDLVLPGMSGVDVLHAWRQDALLSTVPVYVYVGTPAHPFLEAIRAQGLPIQAVVTKPITIAALTQILTTLPAHPASPSS